MIFYLVSFTQHACSSVWKAVHTVREILQFMKNILNCGERYGYHLNIVTANHKKVDILKTRKFEL
jgi:hypothetical protein